MKSRLFKISLSIAILIVAASIAMYLLAYLPYKNDRDRMVKEQMRLADEREKCRKIGRELYEKELEKTEGTNSHTMDPQYTYNMRLRTCLYSGGIFFPGGYSRYVKDVYTNKTIISNGSLNEAPTVEQIKNDTLTDEQRKDQEEAKKFWEIHDQLFTQN